MHAVVSLSHLNGPLPLARGLQEPIEEIVAPAFLVQMLRVLLREGSLPVGADDDPNGSRKSPGIHRGGRQGCQAINLPTTETTTHPGWNGHFGAWAGMVKMTLERAGLPVSQGV